VLVHGSGPGDRDETIGPNKPFKDLAWGLASRGAAVLRYDKRTKVHPGKAIALLSTFTVKDEYIEDALEAVTQLRLTAQINAGRIFVLGHSQGGSVLPRIGKADPHLAGLIILAGGARKLEDTYLDQMTYIFSLGGGPTEEQQKQLEQIRAQVARVKHLRETPAAPADLPLGVPAAYWLDLQDYDPPAVAKTLSQPMLILQGGRDYQVTREDFRRWQDALSFRREATFKVYPKLNHLFIEGEGQITPAEYQTPGHISQQVIEDIANWIQQQ
jgi:dienelactone hydrolase